MTIFTRIDDRLIHGQVVEGWVNFLKAAMIFVADDKVASNALQRSIMELSMPQGLRVSIGGVLEVCGRLRSYSSDAGNAILLFSNPSDLLRALKAGLTCRAVNVGGMRYVPGKRKLMDVLAVDDADMNALREILSMGVKIDIQTVPTAKPLPLEKILEACSMSEKT